MGISRPVRGNKMLARGAVLKDNLCCPTARLAKKIFKIVLVLQRPSGSDTLLNPFKMLVLRECRQYGTGFFFVPVDVTFGEWRVHGGASR